MPGRTSPPQGSMFSAIMATVSSRDPADRQRMVETLLGFVAFFALVMLVRTASASLHGAPSVPDAVVTGLFVGVGYLLLRRWQALERAMSKSGSPSRRAG